MCACSGVRCALRRLHGTHARTQFFQEDVLIASTVYLSDPALREPPKRSDRSAFASGFATLMEDPDDIWASWQGLAVHEVDGKRRDRALEPEDTLLPDPVRQKLLPRTLTLTAEGPDIHFIDGLPGGPIAVVVGCSSFRSDAVAVDPRTGGVVEVVLRPRAGERKSSLKWTDDGRLITAVEVDGRRLESYVPELVEEEGR